MFKDLKDTRDLKDDNALSLKSLLSFPASPLDYRPPSFYDPATGHSLP